MQLVQGSVAPAAEPLLGSVVAKATHPTECGMVAADRDENNSHTPS